MLKLVIIGGGNVAQHLAQAFANARDVALLQVYSRSAVPPGTFPAGVEQIHDLNDLTDADLYIVAVSDNAIADVIKSLPFSGRLVAHTSGMTPLEIEGSNYNAVFYPLQTFSKGREIDYSAIPVCIEASERLHLQILRIAATAISANIHYTNHGQRSALHAAAVFVNNFVNHMYVLGDEICRDNNLPFDILKPLITETAAKVQELMPADAQTGPAKRNDTNTIQAHLAFLQSDELKEIYSQLTKSIQKHVKEL
jgi:predicted short-subunit dehydrogenase-like oxidoreductase (DUF2520 family)